MSVYVGIDVHRKRSQVAVVAGDGKVQLNLSATASVRSADGAWSGSAPRHRWAIERSWSLQRLSELALASRLAQPGDELSQAVKLTARTPETANHAQRPAGLPACANRLMIGNSVANAITSAAP